MSSGGEKRWVAFGEQLRLHNNHEKFMSKDQLKCGIMPGEIERGRVAYKYGERGFFGATY
jgi:hypothetical protein